MGKAGKIVSRVLQTTGMVVIAGGLIAANIVANSFKEIINIYFNGFGADFSNFDSAAGNNICQEIEEEGIVLLKNENNTLPLTNKNANGKIPVAVFGWGATDAGFLTSGSGSGGSAERGAGKLVTFLNALEGQEATIKEGHEILPKVDGKFEYYHPLIEMYKGYNSARDASNYWSAAYPFFNLIEPPASRVQPHIAGAKEFTDTALVVITRAGGEGQDIPRIQKKYHDPNNQSEVVDDNTRTYLELTKEEDDMLELVKNNFENVVIVVNSCNAMDLSFLSDDKIDAAISVSNCGQSGAISIANVLDGTYNPSGKTVDTYAYDLTTAATYANAPDCREINGASGGIRQYTNSSLVYVDYAEGIYNGYRWYETADTMGFWSSQFALDKWNVHSYNEVVQFPFGYGMSYTTFTQEITSVSPMPGTPIVPDTDISITVRVTNTGDVTGKDVVELYYNPPYTPGGVEKSSVNLVAFAKTKDIAKDSHEDVTLTFKASEMKSYDTFNKSGVVSSNGGYVLEAGEYKVSLRSDSHHIIDEKSFNVATSVEIDGETIRNRFTGDGVAKGDVSTDGSDTNEGITYLTRENFQGTFPTPRAPRAKADNMPNDGWLPTDSDTSTTPVQGKRGNLKLYNDDDSLNEELVLKLGADYDDPLWEELLNQITIDELYLAIQGGGFRTRNIKSINKPEHLDLDGPSGLNQEVNAGAGASSTFWTSFPVETAIAQTWNTDISYRFGLTVGYEAYVTGVAGWYGPAANIHRSPFDGRNFEYYSEDPILSGKMCAKTVEGATNNGLYCYVKHFAVNETENKRENLVTWLNEQSLREIYTKSFEIAVREGGANAIMSGFNKVGATWAGGNYALLTGLLRDEWGFRGSIITDYALEWEMGFMDINQGIRAGNSLWLNGLRTDTIGTINNRNDSTTISCARKAVKDILFTFCNTMYRQSEYLKNPIDTAPKSELVGKAFTVAPVVWLWTLIIVFDVVVVLGILTWAFFVWFFPMIRKGKKKETEPIEPTTAE